MRAVGGPPLDDGRFFFVVQLAPGRWFADWSGDVGWSAELGPATWFERHSDAVDALVRAQQLRPWPEGNIQLFMRTAAFYLLVETRTGNHTLRVCGRDDARAAARQVTAHAATLSLEVHRGNRRVASWTCTDGWHATGALQIGGAS